MPRIVAKRPRRGCSHPASRRDVGVALRLFGEACSYGVRAVKLRQGAGCGWCFGRLIVPGRIVLFDQPPSPWRLPGLREDDRRRLEVAGATVEAQAGAVLVRWTPDALRDFMLFDVLAHELGHHRLQHHKGKRAVQIARTRDHEVFASWFAAGCRVALRARAGA